jgi:hypothetical protein
MEHPTNLPAHYRVLLTRLAPRPKRCHSRLQNNPIDNPTFVLRFCRQRDSD